MTKQLEKEWIVSVLSFRASLWESQGMEVRGHIVSAAGKEGAMNGCAQLARI